MPVLQMRGLARSAQMELVDISTNYLILSYLSFPKVARNKLRQLLKRYWKTYLDIKLFFSTVSPFTCRL